ncbi:MAG: M48 family metallopeptidase [Dichotomicrobium sp.]
MDMVHAGAVGGAAASSHWTVKGLDCPLEVRRSPRATRLSLKVSHTRRAAILTLPRRARLEDAGDFVARHLDWLRDQTEKLPQPVPLACGAVVPLRGIAHQLEFIGPVRAESVVSRDSTGDGVWQGYWADAGVAEQGVPLPRLRVSGAPEHAPRRLADWLKGQARADLSSRVEHHAEALGVAPKRIGVRDQATRWGSCSCSGSLSFSWRLIFAPGFVLDYVAAHEVAHLREMNHGPRFWRLVKDTMPEMNAARRWLREYGAELHRFQV